MLLHHHGLHAILLHEPPRCLLKGQASQSWRLVEHKRVPSIGAPDNLTVLGYNPKKRQPQHLLHIQHRHHVLALNHVGANPVHNHLDVPDAVALEEAGDAVGVAEAGDVGRGDEDGLVGGRDGGDEAGVYAGRAIDEDEVGGAAGTRLERVDEPSEGLAAEAEGELGAGLRDAEELEVGPALVANEGLV